MKLRDMIGAVVAATIAAIFAPGLIAAPASAQTIAVVNGTVHTVASAGVIKNGTVIFENGAITAVGAGLAAPKGATVIDAKGAVVTPGLMNSYTFLGLMEVELESSTVDNSAKDAPFSAAFDVSYGLNPNSGTIPVTRIRGVTRAVTAPVPGKTPFAGQGAVISLGEGAAFAVKPRAAVFLTLASQGARLAGGARGAAWVLVRQAFADTRYYAANRRDFDRGQARATVLPALDLEALLPVLEGKIPLAVEARREADIRQVIALAGEFKLKVVLLGASEAWKAAADLAKAGIAVVVDPRDNLPSQFESLGATLDNAPALARAGVKIALAATGDSLQNNPRNLTQVAGIAVANGLPWETALAAMTKNPAEIWGIGANYGTLEKGKDADVVIWSGDPLELATVPSHVFIRGQAIPLTSRQHKLRDRYKDLGNQEPPLGYR